VALVAGAHGVDVGADDISPVAVGRLAPRPFLIGVSVGDRREAAVALGADVDYWSIGSIFATGSKADAGSPVGTVGFRGLARLAPAGIPVIGIGGIDASNAAEVFGSGAQGIAVIGAIFGAGNFEKAARRLRDIVDQASESPTRPPGGAPL
jgi:thiamine-phosphate pyrophosphorylase